MFPILRIGPAAVQAPGLILILGVWLGSWAAERKASLSGISADTLSNMIWISLAAGLVGARIGYVIQHSGAFIADPLSLISPNPGLLDLWSGFIIGLLVGAIYAKHQDMPGWSTLDALTPAFAVIGIAFGFMHLSSGQAYGAETNFGWGIYLWRANRHPSQILEILAATGILIVTWPYRKQSIYQIPGTRFLSFISLSASARLILEIFRGDSSFIPGGIRVAQLAAWGVLALCLTLLGKLIKEASHE